MSTPPLYRDLSINLKLEGMKCKKCGFIAYPEYHRVCLKCGAIDQWEQVKLSSKGTVYTYIVSYYLPAEFETPLPLAIVDLDPPGGRIYAISTETKYEDMKVGLRVELDFREIYNDEGLSVPSFKFKPLRE
ncbi:MAG TPA: OB-fold domain-containing protein [Candidatus Deferrimicrobium sp.]|nr:OB-fold domain-containing protein [Candidatus Deferrimicrobium sp.]